MRHLRWALLAAAILALSASSGAVAANHPDHGGGAVVVPSSSKVSADWHTTFLEMPAAINPRYGTGTDPCVPFGRHGKLLSAIARTGSVTCTAELGTVLNTGVGHFCSDFDPPDSPYYAVGRKDMRACARRVTDELAAKVIVDGRTTDIMEPRFEVYSPYMTVQLPADNDFGVPAQAAKITAFGWDVLVRNLRVGKHLISTVVTFHDGVTASFDHHINIVPRHDKRSG